MRLRTHNNMLKGWYRGAKTLLYRLTKKQIDCCLKSENKILSYKQTVFATFFCSVLLNIHVDKLKALPLIYRGTP